MLRFVGAFIAVIANASGQAAIAQSSGPLRCKRFLYSEMRAKLAPE